RAKTDFAMHLRPVPPTGRPVAKTISPPSIATPARAMPRRKRHSNLSRVSPPPAGDMMTTSKNKPRENPNPHQHRCAVPDNGSSAHRVLNVLKPCRPRNFRNRNLRAWCGGCGVDTGWDGLGEWFTLKTETWEQVWPGTSNEKFLGERTDLRYFLCIGCVEEKLGRKLTPNDFEPDNLLNRPQRGQSKRLRARLKGETNRQ